MSVPTNTTLYNKVKEDAKKRFKRYPSLYASSWIVKEYKERGGKYYGSKSKTGGTTQWYLEQWIMVLPFVKSGKVVTCGSQTNDTKACRPLKRINKSTPTTIGELMKKHNKSDILAMARKKNKNMSKRVNWDKLEFY